jgi:hypothetical protein
MDHLVRLYPRETVERSNGCVGMSVTQPLLLLSNDAPHRASPISPPFAGTWESKRLSRFHAEKRQVWWPNNLYLLVCTES